MVFLGNRERSRAFADSATQQVSHAGQRAEISSTAAHLTVTLGNRERSHAFADSATQQVSHAGQRAEISSTAARLTITQPIRIKLLLRAHFAVSAAQINCFKYRGNLRFHLFIFLFTSIQQLNNN
jgi:phage protein D